MANSVLLEQSPSRRTAPDREVTASRLLATSSKHSYDPDVDVDWSQPLDQGKYFTLPERNSLYGTYLWDQMSQAQRIELTKRELCSVASVGLWTEEILMQMLIRHVMMTDPLSAHHRYALVEVGDECRHSLMFARMIELFGCEARGPGKDVKNLGKIFGHLSSWPLTFAGVMYVEEFTDALQREQMDREDVHPIVRQVSRIHVIEEARHLRYAKDELARQLEGMGRIEFEYTKLLLARVIYLTTTRLLHPSVYSFVGLDPTEARAAAHANPHFIETKRFAARKAIAVLDEAGLIGGPNKRLWRKAQLID